ncbi:MAG: hypothetical protein P0119_03620 [Nitrospira sp.]|nr:hypothetical protein [Nitrospira sp.]
MKRGGSVDFIHVPAPLPGQSSEYHMQVYEVQDGQTGIAGALRPRWSLKNQLKDWHAQDKM